MHICVYIYIYIYTHTHTHTLFIKFLLHVSAHIKPSSGRTLVTCLKLSAYCNVGDAVAQLVEALRYKMKGRGFDTRWCHWNFSLT